jgi:hypothetical protein
MKSRDAGLALATYTLLSHMLVMLRNLELIDDEEARELVEHALLDLETNQGSAKPEDHDTFRMARLYLEAIRKQHAPPKKKKRRRRGSG